MGKMQTALGAFYRHLAARVGKAKAVTATTRKLAVLFDNTLWYSIAYQGPGRLISVRRRYLPDRFARMRSPTRTAAGYRTSSSV